MGLQPAVRWRENDEKVTFRLENVSPAADGAMQAAAWSQVDDGWEKPFPRDGLGMDAVKRNLPRLAAPMVEQMVASAQPWQEALAGFARRADGAGLRWWLTGSGAAALRVPGIEPHDLDIMLDETQLAMAAEVFANDLVEPLVQTNGWVTRAFGVIFPGMRVDLAAGPEDFVDHPEPADFGPWAQEHLETVCWRGHEIRVPPLEVQAAVNRRRGRLERAARIEEVLRGQGQAPEGVILIPDSGSCG
jgi:hypothetical protein